MKVKSFDSKHHSEPQPHGQSESGEPHLQFPMAPVFPWMIIIVCFVYPKIPNTKPTIATAAIKVTAIIKTVAMMSLIPLLDFKASVSSSMACRL